MLHLFIAFSVGQIDEGKQWRFDLKRGDRSTQLGFREKLCLTVFGRKHWQNSGNLHGPFDTCSITICKHLPCAWLQFYESFLNTHSVVCQHEVWRDRGKLKVWSEITVAGYETGPGQHRHRSQSLRSCSNKPCTNAGVKIRTGSFNRVLNTIRSPLNSLLYRFKCIRTRDRTGLLSCDGAKSKLASAKLWQTNVLRKLIDPRLGPTRPFAKSSTTALLTVNKRTGRLHDTMMKAREQRIITQNAPIPRQFQ